MKIRTLTISFLFTIILFSCAQIVPLGGGDKDEEPPKEIKSSPLNGSLNFNAKTIIIEFDEYIQLKNLTNQLIISPIIDPKPEITVKGKKLEIKLAGANLEENTTYSINFGGAIEDITENNTAPNYKYVFSTGNFLDSLSYSGAVVNAFDLTPQEKVYVLLYDKNIDSIPYKELPKYVALTDKEGKYELTNIAEGNYKLFALKDINSNYLFDLPNEEIAFKNELIPLKISKKDNRIELFEEIHEVQYLKKAENKMFGKIDVQFNLPTNDLKISSLEIAPSEAWCIEDKNDAGDSLTLWLTLKNKMEAITIIFKDEDKIIDTANIDIIGDLSDTILSVKSNLTPIFDLNKKLVLTSKRPISIIDTNLIQLIEDSNIVNYNFIKIDNINRKFILDYPFKENTNCKLIVFPAAFQDIYGLKNDTLIESFQTKSIDDYGNIFLVLTPNFTEKYILELYRGQSLVKRIHNAGSQKITFDYLIPGDYSIKLIIDHNNNQKWDTGNYIEHIQPEKVIYYEKEIKIRANWDNEIIWIVKE